MQKRSQKLATRAKPKTLFLVLSLLIVNFQFFILPATANHGPAHRIVCLGDSITVGYAPRFATPQGETCTINAEVGRQTSTMLTEFNTNVRGHGFTDIIVAGGRNDLLGGRSVDTIKNNLGSIYRAARADGMRVIAMTILPAKTFPGYAPSFSTRYRPEIQPAFDELNSWILSNTDVDVKVDTYSLLEDPANPDATNPRYLSGDNLHPNRAGNDVIIRAISEQAFGGPPGEAPPAAVPTSSGTTSSTVSTFTGTGITLEIPFGSTTSIEGTGGYIVNYSRIVFAFAGGIAGLLAMLMLIVAGIQIMTSSGEEQITQAKSRIQGALLGLALLSTSGLLLYLINPCFFSFSESSACTARVSTTGFSSAPTYVAPNVDTSALAGNIPVNPGSMIFPDGSRYQITREDILWTARMIQYEAGSANESHASEIVWMMAQRFYWTRSHRSRSFTEYIRAYSQPINPRWLRDGEFCRSSGVRDNGRPNSYGLDRCSEIRLRRREEAQTIAWESLNAIPRRVTEAFATGQLPNNAVGITDFGSQNREADGSIVQVGCNNASLVFVRNNPPGGDCQTQGVEHLFAARRGSTSSLDAEFERMRVEPAPAS